MRKKRFIGALAFLAFFSGGSGDFALGEPSHVYLLWGLEDARSTISIVFHTKKDISKAEVLFHSKSCKDKSKTCYSQKKETEGEFFEWGNRYVHRADFTGLRPDQKYFFVAGDSSDGFSKEKSFQTLPAEGPLRFVAGGDLDVRSETAQLLTRAKELRPHFLVLGGDLAYGNARTHSVNRWDRFLRMLDQTISSDSLIPIIAAIGNHETRRGGLLGGRIAPYYLAYFPQNADHPTYFKRYFPQDMVLYVLDSGHLVPHDGPQKKWLEENLEKDRGKNIKLATYHVPLFPSHRNFNNKLNRAGRAHWLPLFEKYHLDLAFENHDHTLKRTKPIRNGKPAQKGTIFLGDGSFGVGYRKVYPERDYLAVAKSTYHFWFASLENGVFDLKAIGLPGKTLDQFELDTKKK